MFEGVHCRFYQFTVDIFLLKGMNRMNQLITGHTRLAALFAKPAKHSISPAMHNLSFEDQKWMLSI